MNHKRSKSEMAACAQTCLECAQACGEALTVCCAGRDLRPDQQLLECLIDCMTICQSSASILMRHSPNHMITCRAVAEIAQRCAQNCERFDDPVLARCAEECRGSAASCGTMIGE